MDEFDLGRLTDHDFERVCKDVFEVILGESLEIFTAGADGGIDLRHMSPTGGDVTVVQCKHWFRSGRTKLISHYRNTEAAKVKALSPSRYLIATSVELTPPAKAALSDILAPHIQSTGDILGADEIIAQLRAQPGIVRRHLRLWLSSAGVLDALLNRSLHLRANFFEDEIAETLKTYAPSTAFKAANEILNDHHVLVIAGIPGVGKTTLAHVLAATHRSDGYDLFEIGGNIDDALHVWNDEVPQFYYYDDFLGQTSLRDTVATSEDSRLLQLIRRITASPNKRLVLTTREYILAQARRESERLNDSRDLQLARFVLDISQYSLATRAEILYNHLHFSTLPRDHVEIFADPDVYEPVIHHRNFNPRLVALTFDAAKQIDDTPTESAKRLMDNLESPDALWAHMFDNQMTQVEVDLALIVYTFRKPIEFDKLVAVWSSANQESLGAAGRIVKRGLAALEGTLLRVTGPLTPVSAPRVELHNPSIRDFLRGRLSDDPLLVHGTVERAQRLEQLVTLFSVARGHEGDRLLTALVRIRDLIEQVLLSVLPAELDDVNENGWFRSISDAVDIGTFLRSESVTTYCERALNGQWPDYAEDPSDVVALVQTLRKTPRSSRLRKFEVPLTEWLVAELLYETLEWEALRSAQGYLSELGGPIADAALIQVDEYLFELARSAAEDFIHSGQRPTLTTGQEMLDHLATYDDPDEVFDGYTELRDLIEDELDHQDEWQRDQRSISGTETVGSTAEIAEMMGHLRQGGRTL